MIKGEVIFWPSIMFIILKMKKIWKNKRKKIASKLSKKNRVKTESENKQRMLKIQNFKKNEVQG